MSTGVKIGDIEQVRVLTIAGAGLTAVQTGPGQARLTGAGASDAVDVAFDPTGTTSSETDTQAALAEALAPETFYLYDFAIDGGGTGTIPLRGGDHFPSGAFINSAFVQVITPFTSGGSATVALTTGQAANDIQTAVAFDNAAYSAGVHALSVKKLTTAIRTPAIVIAAANLTAGKIKVLFDVSEGWG